MSTPLPDWRITETAFSPACAKAAEGLFTLGNGLLHIRGSFEEHLIGCPQNMRYTRTPADVTSERMQHPVSRWGTFVPGIYGNHPLLNTELINLPWFLGLMPIVDGEWLDMQESRIADYERTLDLKHAVLSRSVTWQTRSGHTLRLRFERFISMADVEQRLCLQRLSIESDQACTFQVRASIDASVHTNGYDHFTAVDWDFPSADTVTCTVRTDRADSVIVASHLTAFGAEYTRQPITLARCSGFVLHLDVQPGAGCLVEKRTAISTSRDPGHWLPAVQILNDGCTRSYVTQVQRHGDMWEALWEATDIRIASDERHECQTAVRASLHHLLRVHVSNDVRVAIDAKGYSGEAYWGRFFWDTELFLFPYYLYTWPGKAETLVTFRMNTLEAALRHAERTGFAGARYPWESDHVGDECCPSPRFADHELHVTADVVYGLAHYAAAVCASEAEQTAFWSGPAGRVLLETARFWMSRSDPTGGLCDVMGPDEYTPLCTNNAYTNHIVAFNLRLASQYGHLVGAAKSACDAFARRARELPIPSHPDDPDLILQCDGFDQMPDPDFSGLWRDRSRTFASQVSREHVYNTRCPKQADVLMLMAAFPHDFRDDQVRKAWEYYEPITTHDSSLSAGVHCIIACRLGLMDDAWQYWLRCSRLDLHEAAEGIHIANAGATWMALVYGFLGMQSALWSDRLTVRPRLPEQWTRVSVPLIWKGCRVRLDVSRFLDTYHLSITNHSETHEAAVRVEGSETIEAVIPAGGTWVHEGQIRSV